ncbi:MAG: hypothetical protein DMF91_27755 [Acidobacteria bacterium]|nr:MAG: hypothetical protein DMF91_27755 [Acidobacteriota bacterium]
MALRAPRVLRLLFRGRRHRQDHIIGYEHTFTHIVFDLLRNQRAIDAIARAAAGKTWIGVSEV